jgi:hypothetical protein
MDWTAAPVMELEQEGCAEAAQMKISGIATSAARVVVRIEK